MAKPLKATKEMADEAIENLNEQIEKLKKQLLTGVLSSGKIEYKQEWVWDKKDFVRPTVTFTEKAWIKMMALVASTDVEIAWNGTVNRVDENNYVVEDIFMYPQKTAAVTVTVDQAERNEWIAKLPEEVLNKLRFQGHSHVNMAPSPSSTDMASREEIISQIRNGEYYIFMIINKSCAMTCEIYDMVTNAVYDTKDIDVKIPLGDEELKEWVADSKAKYIKKATGYTTNSNKSTLPANTTSKTEKKKDTTPKSNIVSVVKAKDIETWITHKDVLSAELIYRSVKKALENGTLDNEWDAIIDYAGDLYDEMCYEQDQKYGGYGYDSYGGYGYSYPGYKDYR